MAFKSGWKLLLAVESNPSLNFEQAARPAALLLDLWTSIVPLCCVTVGPRYYERTCGDGGRETHN